MNEKIGQLTDAKKQIISALQSLPDSLRLFLAEDSLETLFIKEEVDADIDTLNEFWQFVSENRDKYVIALVGMVNAGKSALGNTLVQKSESEIFQEASIRETHQPTIYNWGTDTILADLPGLGSVLSDEDDKEVRRFINRANLLLITISIDSPIERYLYDFLCSDEVSKRGEEQQIIIVLNKFDVWDVVPHLSKQKKFDRYVEFLRNGDPSLGFQGINTLFDYEIPIVPFSVRHIRNEVAGGNLQNLYSTIAAALSKSSDGWLTRLKNELESYFSKYSALGNHYVGATKELEKINELQDSLVDILQNILLENLTTFYTDVSILDSSCWETMTSQSKPTFIEFVFETEGCLQKKAKLSQIKTDYEGKLYNAFNRFCQTTKKSIRTTIETAFGDSEEIQWANVNTINAALRSMVFGNWEMCYDWHFKEKAPSQETVNSRTVAAKENLYKEIGIWLENTEWLKPLEIERTKKNKDYVEIIESLDGCIRSLVQAREILDRINS